MRIAYNSKIYILLANISQISYNKNTQQTIKQFKKGD